MKGGAGQIRAFIAIEIPDPIKTSLQNLQRSLSASGIRASFSRPETLHLTLKFLGNIRPDQLAALEKGMEKAVSGIPPHRLCAFGLGVFPSVKHARIIWSGIRGETHYLQPLGSALESLLFQSPGINKEAKRFTPHLTLARVKPDTSPDRILSAVMTFRDFQTPDFSVSGISLFQSELSSSGAVHRRIGFTPFQS